MRTKYKSKTRTLTKQSSIVLIALTALFLFGTSCNIIPDVTGCNTVVDNFMKAGAAKDIDTAYSLFVEGVARKDVEKLVLENGDYFDGYEDISMRGINIEYIGPDFAEYKGKAKYYDGKRIGVGAALVKVENEWKLVSVWFT
ncbi:hypothetical protein ACFLTJ_02415 [Chloroflexota bacterium]